MSRSTTSSGRRTSTTDPGRQRPSPRARPVTDRPRALAAGSLRSWSARLLALVGDDDPAVAASRLSAFTRVFALCVASEAWTEVSNLASFGRDLGVHATIAAALTACAVGVWWPRAARPALVGAAAALWVRVLTGLPETANHHFLEAAIASALAFLRTDLVLERVLLVRTLRWLVVVPLVFAGIQKVAHGLWFRGELLSFLIATKASFASALAPLVSAPELARLRALTMAEGAGPFRADAPLLVAVSNLAWGAEIGCGVGLLVPPLRRFAWMAGIALIVAIEIGAREIFFGSTMIGLLLCFARRDLNTRLLPAFVALYLVCLAMVVGLLPRGVFH